MGKPPAFQFYPADFLIGTAFMSHAQVGAYMRLLCHQWDKGPLPQRFAESLVRKDFEEYEVGEIFQKFTKKNGKLFNQRLEDERKKQEEFRALQSERGRKSAESRRGVQGFVYEQPRPYGRSTTVKPTHNQGPLPSGSNGNPTLLSSSSSSSLSSSTSSKKRGTRSKKPLTEWPGNFGLTAKLEAYAVQKGVAKPREEFERFEAKAKAKGWKYKDWERAWMSWCLSEYTKKVSPGEEIYAP